MSTRETSPPGWEPLRESSQEGLPSREIEQEVLDWLDSPDATILAEVDQLALERFQTLDAVEEEPVSGWTRRL